MKPAPALKSSDWRRRKEFRHMLGRVRVRGGSGSGLHGSILSLAPLGCLCANFAANQSRANRRFRAHRLAHQLDAHRFKGTVLLLRGCYSHCYALSAKCGFSVNRPVNHPEKYAFAGNRLGNHALLTIQKMPVCVDTGWIPLDTATLQYGAIPGKT